MNETNKQINKNLRTNIMMSYFMPHLLLLQNNSIIISFPFTNDRGLCYLLFRFAVSLSLNLLRSHFKTSSSSSLVT